MKQGKVTIEKIESELEKEEKQLMCMAITEEKDEVPVSVKDLIENYVPKKPKLKTSN